jgi:hypothetical protein
MFYRVYRLNSIDKIASAAESLDAESDDEALVIVRDRNLGVGCEIWEGTRLVGLVAALQPV